MQKIITKELVSTVLKKDVINVLATKNNILRFDEKNMIYIIEINIDTFIKECKNFCFKSDYRLMSGSFYDARRKKYSCIIDLGLKGEQEADFSIIFDSDVTEADAVLQATQFVIEEMRCQLGTEKNGASK